MLPRKLNTLVKTKYASEVIMFKETLEFKLVTKGKRLSFIAKRFEGPNVGCYISNHFYLEPYAHSL
jgi:hypothetical protein